MGGGGGITGEKEKEIERERERESKRRKQNIVGITTSCIHITTHQTPLHLAARNGYVKCLQILLEYGARYDLENTRRDTPLQVARGHSKKCVMVFEHAIARKTFVLRSEAEGAIAQGIILLWLT